MTYTEEQRAAAVAIFAERGLAAAARESGISKTSITKWAERAGVVTVHPAKMAEAREAAEDRILTLRAALRLSLIQKAADLLDRMDAPHIDFKGKDADTVTYPIAPAAAVQNYATSVGILIDKFRLESGEATGRTETRTLAEGMDDHERDALRRVLDGVLAEVPS